MTTSSPGARSRLSGAYHAVWRWHFYAGLLVMPVLCLLALTGALYLFKPEIEHAAYARYIDTAPVATPVSADRWIAAAETAGRGKATSVLVPAASAEAVRVTVSGEGGDRTVFVDRADARVTGVVGGEGVMGVVKRLHSLELLGRPFNILVEIVAGWAVILVATGVFLWWPRGDGRGVVSVKATDKARRPFWRDLHAVTGLYAGAVIIFLAVTGMPWSAVWGDKVLGVMRDSGLGRPPAPAASSGWAHAGGHDRPAGVGWTMEGMVMEGAGEGRGRADTVLAAAERAGLPRPYTLSIPSEPGRAWTVARETRGAEEARTLYVDAASGAVLGDAAWDRFGAGAKAFEWGIAVHQGLQYGWPNRILMLLGCMAVWMLSVSGLVMWWKRRPRGRLGAPVAPPGPRVRAAVLGIVLPLAVLYPLTGLSLVAAIALDRGFAAVKSHLIKARA